MITLLHNMIKIFCMLIIKSLSSLAKLRNYGNYLKHSFPVLSVRVLETRNIGTEVFPSAKSFDHWTASNDFIQLPREAVLENSEGGLVRLVFVAFDRLEQILKPPSEDQLQMAKVADGYQKMNVTRVLNSKVISASLGKGRHIQLSQPIKLSLRHLKTENVSNPSCVFWDYTVK